jgi:hypothetical protein
MAGWMLDSLAVGWECMKGSAGCGFEEVFKRNDGISFIFEEFQLALKLFWGVPGTSPFHPSVNFMIEEDWRTLSGTVSDKPVPQGNPYKEYKKKKTQNERSIHRI